MNELLLNLLVFHAYINEIHGLRSEIPSKKSRQAALRGGIKFRREMVKTGVALHYDA
jgi:hypothetical protein